MWVYLLKWIRGLSCQKAALEFSTSLMKENLLFERNKDNIYYRKTVWNSVADTRLRCTRSAFQFLTDLLGDCNPSALAAPVWVAELICEHPETHLGVWAACMRYSNWQIPVCNCSVLWSHTARYSYTHMESHCPLWDPRMVNAVSNSAKPQ